ncbi:hypothetical protein SAMN04488097_1132 [Epilithonimonas lactis]|nr:hypothetical protein SAMN04488097_1132 [Epilithonimonas lactis]
MNEVMNIMLNEIKKTAKKAVLMIYILNKVSNSLPDLLQS